MRRAATNVHVQMAISWQGIAKLANPEVRLSIVLFNLARDNPNRKVLLVSTIFKEEFEQMC